MKPERDENITRHLLTLICVLTFMVFLYVLIERTYITAGHATLLLRFLPSYDV